MELFTAVSFEVKNRHPLSLGRRSDDLCLWCFRAGKNQHPKLYTLRTILHPAMHRYIHFLNTLCALSRKNQRILWNTTVLRKVNIGQSGTKQTAFAILRAGQDKKHNLYTTCPYKFMFWMIIYRLLYQRPFLSVLLLIMSIRLIHCNKSIAFNFPRLT